MWGDAVIGGDLLKGQGGLFKFYLYTFLYYYDISFAF